ncbi:uncharacterized protein BDW47DRAFT_68868 [Aspergillus candidus]|uniref:Uncharacterized protein n=1 Tax=Aspergillus candidus TaxID=41067 RepID=A0A2I2F3C2_ASPCN|nr:hypothetical protein BDW47DRAFT_68868 [Aspergillus candidus]PLB35140.1 hypothetical protein BDW47DRAFT_68868 [Aspergillus candidus]
MIERIVDDRPEGAAASTGKCCSQAAGYMLGTGRQLCTRASAYASRIRPTGGGASVQCVFLCGYVVIVLRFKVLCRRHCWFDVALCMVSTYKRGRWAADRSR